jgi:hypothetical protein
MQMERNKSPKPDQFTVEFYQVIWNVIKMDLMAMFVQLQQSEIPLFKLNFRVITFLSKKEDASRIEQYRQFTY